MSKVAIIAAVDPSWVIGINGDMPWHYKADFKRFKALTMGSTLIMGRLTWESLPKPLPGRQCFVLTKQDNPASKHPVGSCTYYRELEAAAEDAKTVREGVNGDTWFVGGETIYRLATHLADLDFIDLTLVPAVEPSLLTKEGSKVTYFPHDRMPTFRLVGESVNEEDPRLIHRRYER